MTQELQNAIQVIRALSSRDKLEILHVITRDLQQGHILADANTAFWPVRTIQELVNEQKVPVYRMNSIQDDNFWPEDEGADEINAYILQRRAEEV
jgi:hypothetical protein